jgi:hypothetical protein
MGRSFSLVLTFIVWTAVLPGAMLPTYTDPPTLMAVTGRGDIIKMIIHPKIMRDRE